MAFVNIHTVDGKYSGINVSYIEHGIEKNILFHHNDPIVDYFMHSKWIVNLPDNVMDENIYFGYSSDFNHLSDFDELSNILTSSFDPETFEFMDYVSSLNSGKYELCKRIESMPEIWHNSEMTNFQEVKDYVSNKIEKESF